MANPTKISRREFLQVTGVTVAAISLGACAESQAPTSTATQPEARGQTTRPVDPATAAPTATAEPQIVVLFPEMVLVEPGSFEMGSSEGHENEQPVHRVMLTRPYYIGVYAVTFDEYDRYLADKKKHLVEFHGPEQGKHPLSGVDWYEAVEYCNWLSEKAGLNPCYSRGGKATQCDFLANGYRLPTEAEWEYAARGGDQSRETLYAGGDDPDEVGWYAENSGGVTHPVGQKAPNELGLYDMSGNQWEWCWDWYDGEYYTTSPIENPTGPLKAPKANFVSRVRRSGSAIESADTLRTTFRSRDEISYAGANGMRLVRTA